MGMCDLLVAKWVEIREISHLKRPVKRHYRFGNMPIPPMGTLKRVPSILRVRVAWRIGVRAPDFLSVIEFRLVGHFVPI